MVHVIAILIGCGSSPAPAPVSQAGLGSASVQVAPLSEFDALIAGIEFGEVDPSEIAVEWGHEAVHEQALSALIEVVQPEPTPEPAPSSSAQKAIARAPELSTVEAGQAQLTAPGQIEVEVASVAPADPMAGLSVDKVIRRYATQTQYCHETAKERYSQVYGRIELSWTIEDGAVSAVEVVDNTTGDEAMATCVARKVQRWRFPSGTSEEVRHPFVFQKQI